MDEMTDEHTQPAEWHALGVEALARLESGGTDDLTLEQWAAAYQLFNSRRWAQRVELSPHLTHPSRLPTLQWALELHVDEGCLLSEALVLEERAVERFRAYVLLLAADPTVGPAGALREVRHVEVLSGWNAETESFDPFGWHRRCATVEPLGASFEGSVFPDAGPEHADGMSMGA